jgi:glycosyltransferase involved in cell wall biosynthesis
MKKILSIIIPVYNEEETLVEIIKRVQNVSLPNYKKEIIIIDDCSEKPIKQIVDQNFPNHDFILHKNPKNQGKGSSVRTGIKKSTGDIVVVQDADLEYDPQDFIKMLPPIESNQASLVNGTRFKGNGPHSLPYFNHLLANKVLSALSNFFSGSN